MKTSDASSGYSSWTIIKTSFYYFAFYSKSKSVYIMMILSLTFLKNIFAGMEVYTSDELSRSNRFIKILILILIYKFANISLNFLTDFLFDKHLIPYGSSVSKIVLQKMLYTDDKAIYNTSGTKVEYFITEGAKSMAKINKFIILGLFSKLIHLAIDLTFVYRKDKTSSKNIFYIVLAGTMILSLIKAIQVRRNIKYLQKSNDQAYERERIFGETMENAHIIKSYRYEDVKACQYLEKSKAWQDAWKTYKFLVYYSDLVYLSLGAIFRISVSATYAYNHSDCKVEDILTVLLVTTEILKTGTNLVRVHKDITESIALAHVVLDHLKLEKEDNSKKMFVDSFNDKLEIIDVTYINRTRIIFSNIDLTLKKGDKAALYGRNGAGKSSIFKLLMNFEDYQGKILFDGINIDKISMQAYRSLVTFVPQDTKLFDDTIYANLAVGNNKSFAEMVFECKKLKLHDTIMMLPLGYNTNVGEGGKNLNGGLRQKIFYARAFLRDSDIYLFDEPTNNLDEANSEFLLEYINDPLYKDKTFLIICHDMDIVKKFPKIFKFDNGDIILEKDQQIG